MIVERESARPTDKVPVGTLAGERSLRVLVGDDDVEMRRLLGDVLRKDGHAVVLAEDGVQAFRKILVDPASPSGFNDEPVDVIVLDIRMPGCTGLEVLESLQSAGREVPVILITAFADEQTRRTARRLGAAAFLSKPFNMELFREAVREVAKA